MKQQNQVMLSGDTSILNREVGRLVGDLLSITGAVAAGDFKQAAMHRLGELLVFDMGLWVSGRMPGPHVHNAFIFNLPDNMLETWEAHKHEDRLLAGLIKNPGVTLDIHDFISRRHRRSLKLYSEHSKHYGIENAISTAVPDPLTGLVDIMSLYRKDADHPFSDNERQIKQFIFPLMIDMCRQNQIAHLGFVSGVMAHGAAAIVDHEGWLRQIDTGFVEFLNGEWPAWTGPALPEPVIYWLSKGAKEHFKCESVVISAVKVGDLFLLRIRVRADTDSLSPRERMVAEIYASGKTHKRIADELNLAPSTVRLHIESVYRKLNVGSKIELSQVLW